MCSGSQPSCLVVLFSPSLVEGGLEIWLCGDYGGNEDQFMVLELKNAGEVV